MRKFFGRNFCVCTKIFDKMRFMCYFLFSSTCVKGYLNWLVCPSAVFRIFVHIRVFFTLLSISANNARFTVRLCVFFGQRAGEKDEFDLVSSEKLATFYPPHERVQFKA